MGHEEPDDLEERLREAAERGMSDEERARQRRAWAEAEEDLDDSDTTEVDPSVH